MTASTAIFAAPIESKSLSTGCALEGDRYFLARMKSAARRKAQLELDEREMLDR